MWYENKLSIMCMAQVTGCKDLKQSDNLYRRKEKYHRKDFSLKSFSAIEERKGLLLHPKKFVDLIWLVKFAKLHSLNTDLIMSRLVKCALPKEHIFLLGVGSARQDISEA